MFGNRHLIGKQVMELEVSSSKYAYTVQQAVSDMVWGRLEREMDDLFDKIVGSDEVVRLDSIEINLGEISLKKGGSDALVAYIVRQLEKKCSAAIRQIYLQRQLDASSLGEWAQMPLPRYHFGLWLHWLEHGVLPTYAISPNNDWLPGILETLALEDKAIVQLQALLKDRPMALNRLVLQHEEKDLRSLVELYTGHPQNGLLNFFTEVRQWIKRNPSIVKRLFFRDLETALWKSVFIQVILKRTKLESAELMENLVRLPVMETITIDFVEGSIGERKKYAKVYPLLSKAFQKASPYRVEMMNKEPVAKEVVAQMETAEASQEIQDLENTDSQAFPQFLANAGMVLLHPFLRKFFEKLGLLEGSVFMDFDSQCKAVLLLHFLATGEENIFDYGLVLPKFLCAMPANLPLDHTLKLSVSEKEEGIHLLQAVIDHWGALGSTSPDGLREGFLQREGKLSKEQTGWKLQVEQKALDVLLDRLPWNLSMVKLPWMKELLYVEWR